MPSRFKPLSLNSDDHGELRDISNSRSLAGGDVLRARMILMLPSGPYVCRDPGAASDHRAHDRALEEAFPGIRRRRSNGNTTSGTETNRDHTQVASTSSEWHSPPAEGWFDPLVRCVSWRGNQTSARFPRPAGAVPRASGTSASLRRRMTPGAASFVCARIRGKIQVVRQQNEIVSPIVSADLHYPLQWPIR